MGAENESLRAFLSGFLTQIVNDGTYTTLRDEVVYASEYAARPHCRLEGPANLPSSHGAGQSPSHGGAGQSPPHVH